MAKSASKNTATSTNKAISSKSSSTSSSSSKQINNSPNRALVIISIGALISFVAAYVYQSTLASLPSSTSPIIHILEPGHHTIPCLDSYPTITGCSPPSSCGRLLREDFLSAAEVSQLREMSKHGMQFGRGTGGPTIFDAVSGAASKEDKFSDAYAAMDAAWKKAVKQNESIEAAAAAAGSTSATTTPTNSFIDPSSFLLTPSQLSLYRTTTQRIKDVVSSSFGVSSLYLTSPSFFSRITSAKARTAHDEYTHSHVDKLQYGSFSYTALIYLADHEKDYSGGEFRFIDKPTTTSSSSSSSSNITYSVLPQRGMLVAFTSGVENTHYVTPVTRGVRHALTIAFTCEKEKSVEETLFKKAEMMWKRHEEWLEQRRRSKREKESEEKN